MKDEMDFMASNRVRNLVNLSSWQRPLAVNALQNQKRFIRQH